MFSLLCTDSCKIARCEYKDMSEINMDDNDYLIVHLDVEDSLSSKKLIDQGFVFLDRMLGIEINLVNYQITEKVKIPDINVVCDTDYSDDIYSIAKAAYLTDRRFHLDTVFSSEKAAPIIDEYINNCKMKDFKIYKAFYEKDLLGYTIVDENVDEKKIFFENVLGVTTPGIKGKMIAPMLYQTMLDCEKKDYKKYFGRVSSSNAASINLHYSLGGKVKRIYDEYILRK